MRNAICLFLKIFEWVSVAPMFVVASLACAEGPLNRADQRLQFVGHLPQPVVERIVTSLSASEVLAAMESGALTAEDYVEILIDRISRNARLNAVISIEPEQVREAARQADAARAAGQGGSLLGLPILVKDSIDTEMLPTTGGTPGLAASSSLDNAAVVQTLLDAGAILLGKTNLHELSAGYTTTNPFTGATLNPYDFSRVPGGSSGGNGAALAARFAPVALGEDTAGSVRVPAALNGIIGFRPTSGRYSQDGVIPLSTTLDTIGPMARTVEDIALIDGVVTGEATTLDHVALDELRIGVPGAYFRELLDPVVQSAIARTLDRLQAAGVEIVEADILIDGELTTGASLAINLFEVPLALSAYLAESGAAVSLTELAAQIASPDVAFLLNLAISGAVTEPEYNAIVGGLLPSLEDVYIGYLEAHDLDAVLLPSNVIPAPRIGEMAVTVDGTEHSVFDLFFRLGHYLPLVRAPALSLPIGQLPDGLPVGGVDLAGRPGEDQRILAIGHAISGVLPRIRPPRNVRPMPVPSPAPYTR